MRRSTIALAARRLIAQGLKLVPTHPVDSTGKCTCSAGAACRSPGKHPHSRHAPHGYNDATDDLEVAERWFVLDLQPGVAVAAAASGLVVLDFDPRNGGADTLAALRAANADFVAAIDATVQARSQGGGWHFYFVAEADVRYPSSLGPGADVKHHGLVMLPPSRGAQGEYTWADGRSIFQRESIPAAAIASVLRPKSIAGRHDDRPTERPDLRALRDLKAALMALDHNDRAMWIKVGYALWTAGELGEQLWFDWSRRSPKYDEADAVSTWASFANSESHWRALFTYAEEAADAWIARLKSKRK